MSEPATTWVFHHGALGDGVLIWPLLRALSPLNLVSALSKARLAARWIEGVTPIDGESPEFSRLFAPAASLEISDTLRRRLACSRRVVSFLSDGADAWAANLRSIRGSAGLHFLPARPPDSHDQPITRFHLEHLARQGLALQAILPEPRRNPDGPVLLHPGSGGRRKCWPATRFEHLAEYLRRIGRPAAFLIGPVESEQWPADLVRHWQRRYELIQPADLIELSERLSRAGLFVGNDSGPAHLAAQLGVPTIALFGPTSPAVWQPVGPLVQVIAPPAPCDMDWLPVESVIEAVARW
jgi:hypothetical protein